VFLDQKNGVRVLEDGQIKKYKQFGIHARNGEPTDLDIGIS